MNNQYEGVLTTDRAQELIQELFAGQTIPIKQIRTEVDEVHKERGGQPPPKRANHPTTYALLQMKELGLADNPKHGVWSLSSKKISRSNVRSQSKDQAKIKTLDQFLKWAKECRRGDYIFRGVPNAEYGIQASAYRRPKKDERSFEKFLQINRDLIMEARLRGYDGKDGRVLKELEILADLQHFGAATCLIDFSHNAQVALRFACEADRKNPQATLDGKVFAVQNSPPGFKEITPALLEKDIDYFLKDGEESQLYYWPPRQQNHRIIAQQSIFVFGRYEFDEDKVCVIAGEKKQEILEELEQVSGITEDRLFPDFEGFARVRSEEVQYTELTASEYKVRGHLFYSKGDYRDAISDFDKVFSLNGGDHEVYYLRGSAKYELRLYSEAIDDFTNAIDLKSDEPDYYFSQGLARYEIKHFSEAKESFTEAIDLNSDDARFYRMKAEACYNLGEYEEAITCFDRAIDLEFSGLADIYYWRGMAKYDISRYSEAIDDFTLAISRDSQSPEYYLQRSKAKKQVRDDPAANDDLKTALRIAKENADTDFIDSIMVTIPARDFDRLIRGLSNETQ